MNQTELLAAIREAAFLPTTTADWTDSVLLRLANAQQQQVFERAIVKARQGYWLKQSIVSAVEGKASYRIPARACSGGLERVQISYLGTGEWRDLDEVDEATAAMHELPSGQTGWVERFCVRGDNLVLLPTPNSVSMQLRIHYYLRPARIAAAQTTPATYGLITAVDTAARTITVSAVPESVTTSGAKTAITSGSTPIDVVGASGWYEAQLVGESQTLSGAVFTCTGSGDMSTIEVGDYVRAADQTDWPALPADFHQALADATALKVLGIRRQSNAEVERDLARALSMLGDLLDPRVQNSGRVIVAPQLYRGTRRGWQVRYP